MIVRPRRSDIIVILRNVGKVLLVLGAAMLLPMTLSLCLAEWKPALDLFIGALCCFLFWGVTHLTCNSSEKPSWIAGMATVALSWLVAMILAAIPLFLSGHFGSFLDACFDAMSGLATTGLTVIHDLDHLAYGTNLWRHLIMFLGGQGIVVIVLTFFVAGSSGATQMYIGEGREERIFPNVISTARFIWVVSLVYFLIGTSVIWSSLLNAGLPAARGLFHSSCLFMAGYDTGGFTPQSQSVFYYHSIWVECATIMVMILGMLNFALHHEVWSGNRRELYRNVEVKTLGVTLFATTLIATLSLAATGTYPGAEALFRKGVYQIISGHSGTGFMTIYGRQFVLQWAPIAMFIAIVVMGLGGAACSTAGGIKALRVNISARAIWIEVKKLLAPPSAVLEHHYHHCRKRLITAWVVRAVLVITACYILAYLVGAIVVTIYGYPISQALFESTSACANVGLTCGITSPYMPALVKVTFIVQMWAGRLEFMSVFLLIAMVIGTLRGR